MRLVHLAEALGAHRDPPPESPEPVSLKTSDRYSTPRRVLACVDRFWQWGIDVDPFADPTSPVVARHKIDARAGGNAYVDDWPGLRCFVNGPYSGAFPQWTAAACADRVRDGHEVLNLCPAAVGSNYWAAEVWPLATAIAWLGRLAFPAGVDVHDAHGRLVCPAGVAHGGNRTEIALVYYGADVDTFRACFGTLGAVTIPY